MIGPEDDDDPDTGVLIQEEFTRRIKVDEVAGNIDPDATVVRTPAARGEAKADKAAEWMEEALKHSATVVRKVDDEDLDTIRAEVVDELPRPPTRSKPVLKTRLASAPTKRTRVPVLSAEVRMDPSVTDEGKPAPKAEPESATPPPVAEKTVPEHTEPTGSASLPAAEPGWVAIQSSLAGLGLSAVVGMVVLTGFWIMR
ncbi:MAG: hypothetical protein AAGA48_29225 [Myxococcota bacterium]